LNWAEVPGTVPTPWNSDFIGMGWDIDDFTKSDGPRQWTVVPGIQKAPRQSLIPELFLLNFLTF
jgi:hypothetical protein